MIALCVSNKNTNNQNINAQKERLLTIDSRLITNVDRLLHENSFKTNINFDFVSNNTQNLKHIENDKGYLKKIFFK